MGGVGRGKRAPLQNLSKCVHAKLPTWATVPRQAEPQLGGPIFHSPPTAISKTRKAGEGRGCAGRRGEKSQSARGWALTNAKKEKRKHRIHIIWCDDVREKRSVGSHPLPSRVVRWLLGVRILSFLSLPLSHLFFLGVCAAVVARLRALCCGKKV